MTRKKTAKKNKRKYTPKPKVEPVELQQYWNLPEKDDGSIEVSENPAEAPAAVDVHETPAPDDNTKIIDIDDYQPVIWLDHEEPAEPESHAEAEAPAESEPVTQLKDDGAEQTVIDFDAEARARKHAKLAARAAGAAFFGVLVLMFVLNIVTKDVLYSDQENRVFQQFPKFSVGNYLSGRFESQLDNYASDQFAGRNGFIKIKSSADLTIGQIAANGVFKAKDNYLMEDITYPDKDSVAADLEALQQFKKKYKGKKMYFMLVPNAANILSDKLPAGVVTRDQNKDIDKILKSVKGMGYSPIDVRKDLAKASRKKQIYYRTDHHWTTDGAYVAYKKAAEVMQLKSDTKYQINVVKKDFVGTLCSKSGFTSGRKDPIKIYLPTGDKYLNSVIRYKDKKEKTTMYYDMANLDIKDAYTVFGGTNQSVITISTPTKKSRHLLVVKDSYANCFVPFLTQDYRTITIVDPRYYYENIATVMKADEIDDVLFLYNANTFFDDNYMRMMLTNR